MGMTKRLDGLKPTFEVGKIIDISHTTFGEELGFDRQTKMTCSFDCNGIRWNVNLYLLRETKIGGFKICYEGNDRWGCQMRWLDWDWGDTFDNVYAPNRKALIEKVKEKVWDAWGKDITLGHIEYDANWASEMNLMLADMTDKERDAWFKKHANDY